MLNDILGKLKKIRDTLDRDKSMPGFQLAQGGLGNRIKSFLNKPVDPNSLPSKFASWGQRNFTQVRPNESFGSYMKRGMGDFLDIGKQEAQGVAQGASFGLYNPKEPTTEIGSLARGVGKFMGYTLPFKAVETGVFGGAANIARLPLKYRLPANIGLGAATMAATYPGSLKERGRVLAQTIKNPTNLAFAAIGSVEPVKKTGFNSVDEVIDSLNNRLKETNKAISEQPSSVKNPSVLRRIWQASLDELSSYGNKGKQIANLIRSTHEQAGFYGGDLKDRIRKVLGKLNKQELETFHQVAQGEMEPISQNQAEAVKVWKSISDKIWKDAKEAGLDLGFVEEYFPQWIIGKKQSTSELFPRGASRRRAFEFARKGNSQYETNPNILYQYIDTAAQRIMEAKHYGVDDKKLYQAIKDAYKEGAPTERMMQIVDQILYKNIKDPMEALSQRIRSFETLKLKPTSALTNLTQNISTAQRVGLGRTLKTIVDIVRNPEEGISAAVRAGEIDPETGAKLVGELENTNFVSRYLKLIGFSVSEKFNRMVATLAGERYTAKLQEMAKQGSEEAVRELKRLGIGVNDNPLIGGKRVSTMTQFNTNVGELPYWAQTALGRMVFQFKGFAYKQTKFMYDELVRVAQELGHGNAKPLANTLATYGIAAPLVGEIISDIKSTFFNRKRDDRGLKRYLSNIAAASSLGLLDMGTLQALTGKYGAKGVASTLLGPIGGDIYGAGEAIANIRSGNKYDLRKAARFGLREIPVVGSTLANTLVPNKYIDNVWGGKNVGLGDKEKQVYLRLKSIDPDRAEKYKNYVKLKSKPSFFDRLFKKDEQVVVEKDYGSLNQDVFNELYSKAKSYVDGYEHNREFIMNDPTIDPAKREEILMRMNEKYNAYKQALSNMGQYDDKVFTAEIKMYNHSHGSIRTKERAEWALQKIKSTPKEKRRALIKLLIDEGVLTKGSRGTIAYLKKLGMDLSSYGVGNKKVKIKQTSASKLKTSSLIKTPKVQPMKRVKITLPKQKKIKIKPTKVGKIDTTVLSKAGQLTKGYKVKPIKVAKVKIR